MRRAFFAVVFFTAAFAANAIKAEDPTTTWSELKTQQVEGVDLHWIERGQGETIVFVHGGLADYREWIPVADRLAGYRRILYSRRYNWPNKNEAATFSHSARTEAEDLSGLIKALDLDSVHLVGVSYGGYTALLTALENPELVSSVTLAEPAVIGWLPQIEGGAELFDDFQKRMWRPSREAALQGDSQKAIQIALDYLAYEGIWDDFPAEVQAEILRNANEWVALVTSEDAFPDKEPHIISTLKTPLLLISGENSLDMHRLIDMEIASRITGATHLVIPQTTHQMCSEKPAVCADAIAALIQATPKH